MTAHMQTMLGNEFYFLCKLKSTHMQTMLENKGNGHAPQHDVSIRGTCPPSFSPLKNGVKVDNIVIALELHELMFHYFYEVDTLKRTILVTPSFIC